MGTGDLSHLVEGMKRARPELTGADIADALWLSRHMGAPTMAVAGPAASRGTSPAPPITPDAGFGEAGAAGAKGAPGRARPSPAPGRGSESGRAASAGRRHDTVRTRAMVLRAPAPPALDDEVALTRALRPLRRRLASRVRFAIDEKATARRIAEEGVWIPVVRPAQDRWLTAAVVLDGARSMDVWSARVGAFTRLLRHLGAFRSVTCWEWHTDRGGGLVHRRARAMEDVAVAPGRVISAAHAQVTFVVSDCVGRFWESAEAAATLHTWAQRSHVVVVQTLPESLWERTRLARTAPVELTTRAAAAANTRFDVTDPWPVFDLDLDGDGEADGRSVGLPVASLEPGALARWARFAMTAERRPMPGVRLAALEGAGGVGGGAAPADGDGDGGEGPVRLERFFAAASPGARRLMRLLAASPHICLPIVRMLRDRTAGASAEAEAEVLLSGLLRATSARGTDPDAVEYRFVEGVRERLLGASDVEASREVLMLVSAYVEEHLGALHGFRAIVAAPEAHRGALAGAEGEMERDAAAILARLGGVYAEVLAPAPTGSANVEAPASEAMENVEAPPDWVQVAEMPEAATANVADERRPYAVLHVEFEEEDPNGVRLRFESVLGGVREERLREGARELRALAEYPNAERLEHFVESHFPQDFLARIQSDPTPSLLIMCEEPVPWDFFPTGHQVARWVPGVPLRRTPTVGPRQAWAVTGGEVMPWEWQVIEGLGCRLVDRARDLFDVGASQPDAVGLVYHADGLFIEAFEEARARPRKRPVRKTRIHWPGGDDEPRPIWFVSGHGTDHMRMLVVNGWVSAVVGMHDGVIVNDDIRQAFTEMFFQVLRSGETILGAVREGLAAVKRIDPTLPPPYFFYGDPMATVEFVDSTASETNVANVEAEANVASEAEVESGLGWMWPLGEPDSRAQWDVAQALVDVCGTIEVGVLVTAESSAAALSRFEQAVNREEYVRQIDTGNACREADVIVTLSDDDFSEIYAKISPEALVIEVGHEGETEASTTPAARFETWPQDPAGMFGEKARPGRLPGDPGIVDALRVGGARAVMAVEELCAVRRHDVAAYGDPFERVGALPVAAQGVIAARILRRNALVSPRPEPALTMATLVEYACCTGIPHEKSALSRLPLRSGGEVGKGGRTFIDAYHGLSSMLLYVASEGGGSERMLEPVFSAAGRLIGRNPASMQVRWFSHDIETIGAVWPTDESSPRLRALPRFSTTYSAPPASEDWTPPARVLVIGGGETVHTSFPSLGEELAWPFARSGFDASTFGMPGFQESFATSVIDAGRAVCHLRHVRMEKPAPLPHVIWTRTQVEAWFHAMVINDAVIIAGGGDEETTVGLMALELGVPVVPLIGTGGAAATVAERMGDLPKDLRDALGSEPQVMISAALHLLNESLGTMGQELA